MAFQRRLASGKWQNRWAERVDGRIVERSKSFTLKKDADEQLAQASRCEERGEQWRPHVVVGVPRLGEGVSAYMEAQARALMPLTLERYKSAFVLLRRFVAETFGDEDIGVDKLSADFLGRGYDWLAKGRHDAPRSAYTKRRIVEKWEACWKWLFDNEWHAAVPRPKTIEMKREAQKAPVSPTWAEMSACINACVSEGPRRLATILYFTGVRTSVALSLPWEAIDLEQGTATMPPHKGLPGYTIPLSPHFVKVLKAWWGGDGGWNEGTGTVCGWQVTHQMAERRLNEAWERAGVREAVWTRAPGKAFRKGLTSGLKQLGADVEAAELYVGRGTAGARKRYLDLGFVPFKPIAKMIPNVNKRRK